MQTNDRRWELIFKELNGTLTEAESAELLSLQKEAMRKTRLNSYGNKVKFVSQDEME